MSTAEKSPQPLSAHPASSSPSPDLPSLLNAFFTCCNKFSYPLAATYLSQNVLCLYQGIVTGTSAHHVLSGVAMSRVCMAEPFVPHAILKEAKEVHVHGPLEHTGTVKGLYVEFAFIREGGDEEATGGRRAKGKYWFCKEGKSGKRVSGEEGEEWEWKIMLQDFEDCGFEMKGDPEEWMKKFKEIEEAEKAKGNWF